MSCFQKPNYIQILAKKVAKNAQEARNRYGLYQIKSTVNYFSWTTNKTLLYDFIAFWKGSQILTKYTDNPIKSK